MDVTQLATFVNTATSEALGEASISTEDLSNIVDIGEAIFSANAVDKYVNALVNHIGKVIVVDRVYKGTAPSVLYDAWEYGSVLEKIRIDLPDAKTSPVWSLTNQQSYDPNVFYQPTVSVKFYNSKTTFQIPYSITRLQVKQSFSSPTQLNAFISGIYTATENSVTVKTEEMVRRAINSMISMTYYDDYAEAEASSKSGIKAVNLLYLYNAANPEIATPAEAINNPDFLRFAGATIERYADRMRSMSTLFNVEGTAKFTPSELQHRVYHADFATAIKYNLYSTSYNRNDVLLPEGEVVPYWQGSGPDYGFDSTSTVMVTQNGHTTTVPNVLAVIFDRDALGVCNLDKRVTTNYNPVAEFYTNFYNVDAAYFNDPAENFVFFFMA